MGITNPVTAQSIGAVPNSEIEFGTYTPTFSSILNVAATTPFLAQYMRVGNAVTVSGEVTITPTNASTVALGISLPVASDFTADNECAGMGIVAGGGANIGGIRASAANNVAQLVYNASPLGTTPTNFFFQFTYTIK